MHYQVGIRNTRVDRLDLLDGQNVAGGRTGELVSTMAGADGDGQGIHLGLLHEVSGFFRVSEHLLVGQFARRADAIFFTGFAGFQGTQTTQFAFHRHATGVSHFHGTTSHVHVVLVVGGGLAVFTQGTIHHHRGETQLDRTLAHRRAGAVILVHHHRDMGEFFYRRQNQVTQERGAGVFTRAGRRLHDHRGIGLVRRFHDGAHLFQVVYVESRNAIAKLGGVIQQLTHAYKCHCRFPFVYSCAGRLRPALKTRRTSNLRRPIHH